MTKTSLTPDPPDPFSNLLVDCRPFPEPGQIQVTGRRLIVGMVINRESSYRSRIAPTVVLDMPVGERNNPAAVVRTIGKIEEAILVHVNAEIGPADAFRI